MESVRDEVRRFTRHDDAIVDVEFSQPDLFLEFPLVVRHNFAQA